MSDDSRVVVGDYATYVEKSIQQVVQAPGWLRWVALVGAAVLAGVVIGVLVGTLTGQTVGVFTGVAVGALVLAGSAMWSLRLQIAAARAARAEVLRPLWLPPLDPHVHSVSTLIAPERALAPLESRRSKLDELRVWCLSPTRGPVHILDGSSGVGKTRLAVQLGQQLIGQYWAVGRVAQNQVGAVVARARACPDPALVVIDDADTQPDIQGLVEQLTTLTTPLRLPVKALLVVRNGAKFLEALNKPLPPSLAAAWPILTLTPAGGEGDRIRWFDKAVKHYAAAVQRTPIDWALNRKTSVGVAGEAMVITQIRAALTVLTDNPETALRFRNAPVDDLAEPLLTIERARWQAAAADPTRRLPTELTAEELDNAILTLATTGASTSQEAVDDLRRTPGLEGFGDDKLEQVVDWAAHVYPGPPGHAMVDPAHDIILGILMSRYVASRADHGSAGLSIDLKTVAIQRPEFLTRLARATQQFPSLTPTVASLLTTPHLVATVLIHLATTGIKDLHLQTMIARAITDHPPKSDTAQELRDRLLDEGGWVGIRVVLDRILLQAARDERDGDDTEDATEQIATRLCQLAADLEQALMAQEAVQAGREAVDLRRLLADGAPERYTPSLAAECGHLSRCLAATGAVGEALVFGQESVTLYRSLVADNPAGNTPGLASALDNLGNRLDDIGAPDEALGTSRESVGLYRSLVADDPAGYTPGLASALDNLGKRLDDIGAVDEALEASRESVGLYRSLVAGKPARYTHGLATALDHLSNRLADAGADEEALGDSRESVSLFRSLVADNPARNTAGLASALDNLSHRLAATGAADEGLRANRESVTLYRSLVADNPARYRPHLAIALNNYSIQLHGIEAAEDALDASQESVRLYRSLVAASPTKYSAQLATALHNLSIRLVGIGADEEALNAAQESVTLYRTLVAANPTMYSAELATSLHSLSHRLADVGAAEEALDASQESVRLLRVVVEEHPGRHERDLDRGVEQLARRFEAAGMDGDAWDLRLHHATDVAERVANKFQRPLGP